MRMSIRRFLLICLLVSELLATFLAVSTVVILERYEIESSIDDQLIESAFLMQNLIAQPEAAKKLQELEIHLTYLRNLFLLPLTKNNDGLAADTFRIHVWDGLGNKLFGTQDYLPDYFSNSALGFSETIQNNKKWRAFTTIDPSNGLKITVLQETEITGFIPGHLIQEIILVMLLSSVFLGIFMWGAFTYALKALSKMSTQVQRQVPEHFTEIDPAEFPVEIKPIAEEWNKLFVRLKLALEREKRFAADAAHELKTPLAALKTHTQLALNAKNESELINALHKVVAGVNRSAHVVKQLLTLNQMSQSSITEAPGPVDILQQTREIISDLVPEALEKETEIELIAPEKNLVISGHAAAIGILIRNLVDNAIRYSPEHSLVQVLADESPNGRHVILKVIDNGPGIPENLRQRVFERFFRVIGNKSGGSGLGLGIVQQIVELHDAVISLETPASGHGLQITVVFHSLKCKK